ncbi:MAG: hypothetical protein HYV97_06935 [Bdellovibrio sp.]|nr:hypothetical protein [Bdellovibrio sp.]
MAKLILCMIIALLFSACIASNNENEKDTQKIGAYSTHARPAQTGLRQVPSL